MIFVFPGVLLSLCVEVPSCSWFLHFFAAANFSLAKKTEGLMLTFATSWWNVISIQVKHCVDGLIRPVKGGWRYYLGKSGGLRKNITGHIIIYTPYH